MKNWKKEHSQTVDQRDLILPPAWIPEAPVEFASIESNYEVFQSGPGRLVANKLIDMCGSAKEMVVLSSFLLADQHIEDALLAAAGRGVRIYVMLASEARLENDDSQEPFDKRVIKQHKEMLTRLSGHVLFRSAPHFHAKVVLVDPMFADSSGLLLTANVTKEALERNQELAVELNNVEIEQIFGLLRWAMWESAEHEKAGPKEQFRPVKPLGIADYPDLADGVVATTEHEQGIHQCALSVIDSAMEELLVSSFGWDIDHPVVKRLCDRAREGLKVTVLARKRPASMPALIALHKAGATVIGYKWLHAKAIWSDAGEALVMSANLQTDGLDRGFEIGVHLSDVRSEWLKEHLDSWVEQAPTTLDSAPRLGNLTGKVEIWEHGKLAEVEISESKEISLGNHESESAEDLEYRPTLPEGPSIPNTHELLYRWEVTAPRLKPKSKPQHQKTKDKSKPPVSYPLPVFKEPNGRKVVAISTPDQLAEAKLIMKEAQATAVVVDSGAVA